MALTPRQRFIDTLACKPVDRPPVWLMRQAGRTLPEYRAIRADRTFLEVMKTPALATEVTLQPLRRFGQDVAVVFSDILTVPEAMGLDLAFIKGKGPKISPLVDGIEEIPLRPMDPARDVAWLGETLDNLRAELGDGAGIVGFAGAPFTLLSYMCERLGKEAANGAKRLMMTNPERGHAILDQLTDSVIALLRYQLQHDVDAVQLFDTWAGSLAAPDHAAWIQPYNKRIVDTIRADGANIILYAKDAPHLLDNLIDTGASGLSVDWRTDLPALAKRLDSGGPPTLALQGNIDPASLFGPPADITRRVNTLHAAMEGRAGHVFNLGHGLHPTTPIEGIAAFIDAVKAL